MSKINNDDLIRAVFTATDEAKTKALAVLEGRDDTVPNSGPLLLTMGQGAELLNVSRATLWRTIKSGRIVKVELYPGAFRLRRSDLIALVGPRRANVDAPPSSRSPSRKNPSDPLGCSSSAAGGKKSSPATCTPKGGASC